MKNIFFLSLLLLSSGVFGQDTLDKKNEIPKKAKVFVVTTEYSSDQLFEKVSKALFDNGYELETPDKSTGIIQSKYKKTKSGWWVKLKTSIENNEVKIRGMVSPEEGGRNAIEIDNSGPKRYMVGIAEMDKIAKSIPHTKIAYLL